MSDRMAELEHEVEVPWARLDMDTGRLTCDRCGGSEEGPKLPMVLDQFVDVLHGFARRHTDCQEAEA